MQYHKRARVTGETPQLIIRHCQECEMMSVGESHEEVAEYHERHMEFAHSRIVA